METVGHNVVICGDININLYDWKKNKEVNEYLNILAGNEFYSLINEPTRIDHNSETIIDHIFLKTRNINPQIISGSILMNISDHLPNVMFIIGKSHNRKQYYIYRDTRHKYLEKLKQNLESVNWNTTILSSDGNPNFKLFYNVIIKALEETCPVKIKIRKCTDPPWIINGIKKAIKGNMNCILNT